jgi:NADH dehydrogenase
MKIVVTGGTGFIGREIVRRLLHDGQHEIVVTTRNPTRDLWGGRVRLEQAFAGDRLSLGKAFTGAEVVVHAIQFPNHPVEKPSLGRTYMEVDGLGTVAAAETARKLGVRRFVYMSGAGAGQGRDKPWFRAKDMAEDAIRASGMEHGILRPSWIYGPNDRSMNRLATFIRRWWATARRPCIPSTCRTWPAARRSWCSARTPRRPCSSWAASA